MQQAPKLAAIILAAGQGTRMKSDKAKVLHALDGEPLFSYPVRLAQSLGAAPIVLVVGHQRDAVRARASAMFGEALTFADQTEQKGTGHAVKIGLEPIEGALADADRVLILYGDVPLLTKATIDALVALPGALSLVTTRVANPKGYGRIVRDGAGKVARIVEEKDASDAERKIDEINAGIYLVEAGFLRGALGRLRNDNAQREYYLTDIVAMAIAAGRDVGTVLTPDPGEVLGVNTKAELAYMESLVRKATNDRLMRDGVSIIDPERTYVSARAKVGRDTVLYPGVHIRGASELGEGCVVDAGCVLVDAKIGAGVELKPYTVVESAIVHDEAIIGPFSRLRPQAEIMPAAHVGNFVELKNTKLGKGSKANHLAYLGDAVIGEGANVGAGTITCNYDGYGKYKTEIGDGVFVGSNATLVAPVKIEKEAYVAAGSTITEDVGPSDLAFGRARQDTKKGRGEEIRRRAKERAAEAKKAKASK
ncbi:bifunctional UDP-N-acetylglucosamine diphosphorylase/glucosamine-1-phosphate N-acetyltransferase GlmU [Myxococcota bacterium]|nr:bifunctional UDP-N-acetylglucosamine diphosphorylase/glucosamine-1-phosphate N-acetyltransferase GlmU [Myxococcota bacterium]